MNIRFETVNEINVNNDIAKQALDITMERLKQEMTKKLNTVASVFNSNEIVVVTIDYDKSSASISAENVPNERIELVRRAINSIS